MSEQEVYEHLRALAARNVSAEDEVSFLGAGMYDHYVPSLVDSIISRSEFLTPYTPYQPEISQGGLQVMFEYQTAISELTGLPVSNASVYEGPTAVGAAGYLAKLANGRPRHLVSRGVHPHSRETLATLSVGYGTTVEEVPLRDGATDSTRSRRCSPTTSARSSSSSRTSSARSRTSRRSPRPAKARGALVVAACDPLPLGLLRSPGECGVDVAVGEGQTLGNRLDFGGPVVRLLRRDRGAPAPDARPHRGGDHRRRRPPRLRAHPPDPRAAHPPREGDLEHLHRPGAERARRRDLPELARARAGSSSSASCWSAAPPTRATRWPGSTA